jgi:choline-sulfatase
MRPRLTIAVGALLLLSSTAWLLRPVWRERRLRAAPRPLDVILITLDTTRADKLGAYGGDPGVSPSLDALARRGVVFRSAIAHVPLTLPSHASLLTGLLPPRHGVRDNAGFVLGEEVPTLAEQFARAGYRTAAFVSAFVLDRRFGLARGFETYVDEMPPDPAEPARASCRAGVTVNRALAWLSAESVRPIFLWVHLYDPHDPYRPPEPFASRFAGRPYDGEIAYMDSEVGRLLAAVEARRRPRLVAAIADHGEALGEHRERTHSYFIYASTQRVPFILSLPGWMPEGREVDAVVRGVDLMPTVLDLAGLPPVPALDGRSLVSLVAGRTRQAPGPAYLESYTPRFHWGARELLGLRTDRWLYIRSPRPELYDLEADPAETVNLAVEKPAERDALEARLSAVAPPGSASLAPARDPEAEQRLQALGYAAGSSPAGKASELRDAKDNAEMLAAFDEAEDRFDQGDYEGALSKFREALKLNPGAVALRSRIAKTLLRLGHFDESLAEFRTLGDERPRDEAHFSGMIQSLASQGRKADALALAREAVASLPGSVGLQRQLGGRLMDAGKPAEAEAAFRKATELAPRDLGARLGLAMALKGLGRPGEAAAAFAEVVERSPRSPEARRSGQELTILAEGFAGAGRFEDVRSAYLAAHRAGVSSEGSYLNLALACHRLGQGEEVLRILLEGVERFPDSAELSYRSGRVLLDAGRAPEAVDRLRKALERAPEHQAARLQLAIALQRRGRTDEAVTLLKAVLEAVPDSKEGQRARQALARLQASP